MHPKEREMSGFVIAEVLEVRDPEALKEYATLTQPTVARYGGRYRVLRGQMEVKEGDWRPGPLVMLEFPSLARAREWYDSPEYRPLIAKRQAASRMNFVFVEGLPA
jgi:uncharacterized protein (DUF1330 family)